MGPGKSKLDCDSFVAVAACWAEAGRTSPRARLYLQPARVCRGWRWGELGSEHARHCAFKAHAPCRSPWLSHLHAHSMLTLTFASFSKTDVGMEGPRLRRRSRLCGHPARIATICQRRWRPAVAERSPDRLSLRVTSPITCVSRRPSQQFRRLSVLCVCVCALCPSQRMHQFQLSVSLLVFLLLRFSTRTPATGAPDRIDLKFCGTDEAPDGRVLTWVDLLLQRSFKEFPSVQCSAFGWISFCFKSLGQHTRTLLRA